MTTLNHRVRPATADDADTIVRLIRALAQFENEPLTSIKITADDVRRDAFGPNPRFEALIAELDTDGPSEPNGEPNREPVGLALFFHTYSTWEASPTLWLEDLFLEERARGLGLAHQLLAALARIARDRGCGRLELSVLHWNPAREFYHRHGFRHMDEWLLYRLDGEPFAALADGADSDTDRV
jgi:GNAT superfamily N-acetyltransferase